MALPTTISGISTAVACVGPFKSSAGNYYFIGVSSSTTTKLQAQKATDPTSSFSAVGTDPTGSSSVAIAAVAAYQVSDVVHVVSCGGGSSLTSEYRYHTFDMASDAWSVTNELIDGSAIDARTSGGTAQRAASVVVRSSDSEVIVVYNGARQAVMGNSYSRIVAKRRTGTNTWVAADGVTNPTPLDAGGQTDWINPEAVLGSSDRTHFFWTATSLTSVRHRALTSANALQTVGSGSNSTGGNPLSAIAYDDSGTTRVICSFVSSSADTFDYFDSANTPTLNASSKSDNFETFGRLFNDGATAYAVCRKSTDSDLYVISSTDAGANWSASTNIFTATIANADANLSRDGNIYQRGSDFVIPYIVNDNGTLKYNEYVVRSVASDELFAQSVM